MALGSSDGFCDGLILGSRDGVNDGKSLGSSDGIALGSNDGFEDGLTVFLHNPHVKGHSFSAFIPPMTFL